jgi:hypothetical protein
VTINGGTASSLNKYPRFKLIEIDEQYFVPQKIISYAYDVDLASSDTDSADYDVLFTQMTFPDTFSTYMTDCSPSDFYDLA